MEKVTEIEIVNKDIAYLKTRMDEMKVAFTERLDGIERKLDQVIRDFREEYVTRLEFGPIQKIVYGVVGVILSSFLAGLIALVITISH